MTDGQIVYRLTGWLRLVAGDCLGIAVFSDGSNIQFLPETDDRLRILDFHTFFNEDNYTIERCLPPGADAAAYLIGSGVPIPFAKDGMTVIANSEAGSRAFLEGQDRDAPIIRSVAEIIERAETGVFAREGLARKELEFEGRHSAVFFQAPVHSRYWIELFKRAALEVGTLPDHARTPVQAKLKLISEDWIKRFRLSGDPVLLGIFLQEAKNFGIIKRAYVKTTYYEVAAHLLASGKHKYLLAPKLVYQIEKAIPEGLYYYEVDARYSKRTKRPTRLTDDMGDMLSHMRMILREGTKNLDFRMAMVAANLMFGRGELHAGVYSQANTIARDLVDQIERAVESYLGVPPDHLADQVVTAYRALVTLRQMMDWQERSESTVVALGLSQTATFLIEQWLEDRA